MGNLKRHPRDSIRRGYSRLSAAQIVAAYRELSAGYRRKVSIWAWARERRIVGPIVEAIRVCDYRGSSGAQKLGERLWEEIQEYHASV